jgi:hypothetical protein
MEKLRIMNLVAIFMVLSTAFACNTNSTENDTEEGMRQLSELEKMMSVQFPSGSRIVYTENNGRNNESYDYHIIYSPSPVGFNHQPVSKTPSEDYLETLKKVSVSQDLGKLKDKWTYRYEGTVGNSEWRARQTNFETGSYLVIKKIFLGK